MRALCTVGMCASLLAAPSVAQEDTASLAGKAVDITGAGVSGTVADLRSEQSPPQKYRAVADDSRVYRFPAITGGVYTAELQQPGFQSLIVKHIKVSGGERKVMPTIRIDVGVGCSPHAVVEYLRLEKRQGSLAGTIKVDRGPLHNDGALIGSAKVDLICGKGTVCGATTTNAKGEFAFQNLSPGNYAIRTNHAGFYPLAEPGYEVRAGLESTYFPLYLERCPLGNCDPRLPPKRPPARCNDTETQTDLVKLCRALSTVRYASSAS
jgi:hypothetical protein